MTTQLLARKSVDTMIAEAEHGSQLRRVLGPVQLTVLGVGAIIGAGIFSTIGTASAGGAGHTGAGPAIAVSFALIAAVCGLAALCYAEFAAMVPIAGSAYTYAYATLGEFVAWIIGWDLICEYAVGNVAVAISWSGYCQELLRGLGMPLPSWLGTDYRTAHSAVAALQAVQNQLSALTPDLQLAARAWTEAPHIAGIPLIFNLPAFLVVTIITVVLVKGIKESAWATTATTVTNVVIILFFCILGAFYIEPANWTPFAPNGASGILGAAAIIFFAYIGFDAISTTAEETRNPQRDMPIGMIASLVICTVIYIAVAITLTGLLRWDRLGTAQPLATAYSALGMTWASVVISLGAMLACTSVLMVMQLGQARIFFSMARDGLLPPWAATVHPRYRTPHLTTILIGVAVAAFASCTNIAEVVELSNIGTLFAFLLVSAGIIVLRHIDPGRKRPFRTPFVPWVPLLSIASCALLMYQLPVRTWWRFVIWLAVGLLLYFAYGYRHSRLREQASTAAQGRS